MPESNANKISLFKRLVELVKPNLRHYYRIVRKAKVVKTYASDGRYWADVRPLRNDETIDENEPVIPQVEIPVMWGGPDRGVVCPPAVGTLCDLSYYDGDPNYPRISNFRWQGMNAPEVEIGGLVIQREPGTRIRIGNDNAIQILSATSVDIKAPLVTIRAASIQHIREDG
ncbi:MAG: baseplate assembly protein [Magnetococcales bacterium]|nr:baseplate assembly protein [Magnetococcales bacterium]